MRKCLFQFAVLLAATLIATSSVSAAEKPSFGFLGGLHLANLAFNPDPTDANLDFIRRANIGGLVELGLGPNASLQARCMYVPKGAGLEDLTEEFDLRATTFIDYITVPVLLKIQADTAKIRPYAVVGPELGFKIRAGASLTTTASVPGDILNMAEKELSDQIDDYSKSIDVALDFGGGIEIPSGRMSILIEGIYSLGLRNIAIPSEGEDGSAKTRTFLFNIGVRF
jgi:hypothetical protein